MNKLLAALIAGAFAFGSVSTMAQEKTQGSVSTMAQEKTQSFIPTPAEQARLKAERATAKAKWAGMTAEEKAATKKAASAKKRAELTAIEDMSMGEGDDFFNAKEGAKATAESKAGPKPMKPSPEAVKEQQKSKGQ